MGGAHETHDFMVAADCEGTMALIIVTAVLSVVMTSLVLASPAKAAVQEITGTEVIAGVACPSSTQCLAVGGNGDDAMAVPLNPATGAISSGQGVQTLSGIANFNGVACSSSTQCLAVGEDSAFEAVAVPINPATGAISSGQSAQTNSAIIYFNGVACTSSTQCLAVGENNEAKR